MSTMTRQVVYVVPDVTEPSGGVHAIYRHAELAGRTGVDAKVWHLAEDFRCWWFSSSAKVISGETVELGPDDLLVVPEVLVMDGFDPAPGVRKVIYNQNHYYTYDNFSGTDYPAWKPAPQVWAGSVMTTNVLKALLPKLKVQLVPNVIDTGLYRFAEERKRKIVLLPRKRPREATVLTSIFKNDKRFAGVEVVALDDVTEQQIADELADASIFIALHRDEGFGLPVAQALAAGCVVVGYPAGGGAEQFTAPGTHAVEDADVLSIVEKTAAVLAQEPSIDERRSYRAWVEEHYSEDSLVEHLRAAITAATRTKAKGGTARHPLTQVVVPDTDPAADQLERSLAFAEEQKAARERAESVATGLEEALGKALAELEESRSREYVVAQELHDLKSEYAELAKAAERLTALDEATTLLAEYARDNDRLNRRLDEEIRQHTHWRTTLQDKIDDLERSTSWRVTAPLRKATGVIKGGRNA
ncbi:glycosyltransferase [Lentzea sp. E54]|uniref:glycosyltransferase n=1 Tax=Lentzea xerophila TaxID=3435883 RepID=UPI003DA39EDC